MSLIDDTSSLDSITDSENENLSENNTEKYDYCLLEYSKNDNKFIVKNLKFSDTLDNLEQLNLELVNLYDVIISHHKINHIILPIYEGKLIKENTTLSVFKSPFIIIKLDISLLVNVRTPRMPTNLLNMDINSIISSILSHNRNPSTQEDDDENIINSQGDLANMASQLMNIYSSSSQSLNNFRNENEEKYREEIIQITNMGFNNREKIIQSLVVCNGNVEQAINYYLSTDQV